MQTRKFWKSLLTVILTISAIYISFINLGSQYMWSDEVYSFHAAEMILEKGEPLYDSGLYYGRAIIYHQFLAFSMSIFGENEFGSRIINLPFLIGIGILVGIFVYDLLKKTKLSKEKNLVISFLSGLAYYISNFSTAMLRETRMYTMSIFFFFLAVYLFYKAFIDIPKRGSGRLPWFDLNFNIYLLLGGLLSFYVAYVTQPICILFGLGIIVFFIVWGIFKKNYKYFLISLFFLIFGLLYVFKSFDTFNISEILKEFSPNWATTFTPLYYSILTVRNFPFVLFSIPLSIYFIFKKKDIYITYIGSLLITFWGILSLQSAQHERYWQNVIPLLIVIAVYVCVLFFQEERKKLPRIILIVLIVISSVFHVYLAGKEYLEIDTYTPHSISIHKKLQFNGLFNYLDINLKDGDFLVADFHSAYTLYEKGYNVDYLLLPDDDVNIGWGKDDLYFDIPIVKYSELEDITNERDGYIVIRDSENFGEIEGVETEELRRPVVYKF